MRVFTKIKIIEKTNFSAFSFIPRNPSFAFSRMEKKKQPKSNFNKQKQAEIPQKMPEIPSSIYHKNESVYIMVNAKPNSKVSAITGINEEAVDISVAAPAKDNEANEELLAFLSETLGVKKTSLSLDRGGKSRSKLFVLDDTGYSAEEVYSILKKALE